MPIPEEVIISVEEEGGKGVEETFDRIDKAIERVDASGKKQGATLKKSAEAATKAASGLEKELEKIKQQGALKKAALENKDFIKAAQASRKAARDLTAAIREPEIAAKRAAKEQISAAREAAAAQKAASKEAGRVAREEAQATMRAARELSAAIKAEAREATAVRNAATREAAAIEKQLGAERKASEREATAAIKARAKAEESAFKASAKLQDERDKAIEAEANARDELLSKAKAALTAMGRGMEDVNAQSEDQLKFLERINDELEEAESQRAFAKQALQSKAFVNQLKAANAAQKKLETATESFGERVAIFLEGAENVEGLVGVITIGTDAVAAFWGAWKSGAAQADMASTLQNFGVLADDIERIRQRGGGVQTTQQVQQGQIGGTLDRLTASQIDQISVLAARAATIRGGAEGITGEELGKLQTGFDKSLQESIKSGRIGEVGELLIGGEAQLNAQLEALAREVGATVDTLTAEQRSRLTLTALLDQSSDRTSAIDASRSQGAARLEADLRSIPAALAASLQTSPSGGGDVLRLAGVTAEQVRAAQGRGAGAVSELGAESITRLVDGLNRALARGDQDSADRITSAITGLGAVIRLEDIKSQGAIVGQRAALQGAPNTGDPAQLAGGLAAAELLKASAAEQNRFAANRITLENEILGTQRTRQELGVEALQAASEALLLSEDTLTADQQIAAIFAGGDATRQQQTASRREALALALGTNAADAQGILTGTTRASQEQLAASFAAEALKLQRETLAQREAFVDSQLALGDALTDQQRQELELQKVELARSAALAADVETVRELEERLESTREVQALTVQQEAALLGLREQSRDVLIDTERDELDIAQALNVIQQQALTATTTAEEFADAVTEGAIQQALQAQGDSWDEILGSLGLTREEIALATKDAISFEQELRAAVATGVGARDILAGVLGGGGDEDVEKQLEDQAKDAEAASRSRSSSRGGGFDAEGFLRDMRRAQDAARLEMTRGNDALVAELLRQTPAALIAITGGSGRLVQEIDAELAAATVELDQWREDQTRAAQGNAEAINAVNATFVARADSLKLQLRESVFAAGVESAKAFAGGLLSGAQAAGEGVLEFGEEAADNFALVQQSIARRLDAEADGAGALFLDRAAAEQEFALLEEQVRGNFDAMNALKEDRLLREQEFNAREAEIVATHRHALAEQWFGQAADLKSATDSQLAEFDAISGGAQGIVHAADSVLAAGDIMSQALAGIIENEKLLAEGKISETEAAVKGAAGTIAAAGSVTAGLVKNEKAAAGLRGTVQIARVAESVADGNIPGAVLHGVAAAKYFAIAGGGSGSGGGGGGGGGGASSSAAAGSTATPSRAFAQRRGTTSSVTGAALRAQAAPTSITLVNITMDAITGKSVKEVVNRDSQNGGLLQFDRRSVSTGVQRRFDR